MWNPGQYHRFQKERSAPFHDLIAILKNQSPYPSMDFAVDLGCGSGELTQILHERFQCGNTLGIDNSPEMLTQAKTISQKGLTFKQARVEDFVTDAGQRFDLVFSNAALHWCENHPELFRKLFRILNSGGQLAIQMPANQDYPTHQIANALGAEAPYRNLLPQRSSAHAVLPPEDYAALLYRLGFSEQSVRLQVYPHLLDSREQVIEWVKGTLLTYYQSHLPKTEYERFLGEFKHRLFAKLPDEKPFFYPFKRILIWARK